VYDIDMSEQEPNAIDKQELKHKIELQLAVVASIKGVSDIQHDPEADQHLREWTAGQQVSYAQAFADIYDDVKLNIDDPLHHKLNDDSHSQPYIQEFVNRVETRHEELSSDSEKLQLA